MPYIHTTPRLPWSGATVTSRHTSHEAALSAAASRGQKQQQYLAWLRAVGTATDAEAAQQLGWPLSSICSIRNGLGARVAVAGITEGRYGRRVTLWRAQ